jgi:hypothetical protein
MYGTIAHPTATISDRTGTIIVESRGGDGH